MHDSSFRPYVLGYWINRYALWYRIERFADPIDLVRFLKSAAEKNGLDAIDFIVYRID